MNKKEGKSMKKKNIAGLIAIVAIVAIVAVVISVEFLRVDDRIIPEELRYPEAYLYEAEQYETDRLVEYWTEDNGNEVITYYQELSGWTTSYILDADETRRKMLPIKCAEDSAAIGIERGSASCKIVYCGASSQGGGSVGGLISLLYYPPTAPTPK